MNGNESQCSGGVLDNDVRVNYYYNSSNVNLSL